MDRLQINMDSDRTFLLRVVTQNAGTMCTVLKTNLQKLAKEIYSQHNQSSTKAQLILTRRRRYSWLTVSLRFPQEHINSKLALFNICL